MTEVMLSYNVKVRSKRLL